ncbi:hypothetical protein GOZ88_12305, partial [Agrobacterium vitis]|nr:hypothetical protein [Agrobacterium vitis]
PAARRHHIGKMKFKVTNRAEYEAGLRRRGSLTLWITPEAIRSSPSLDGRNRISRAIEDQVLHVYRSMHQRHVQ